MLGFTQAFASFGGLLVAVVNYTIEGAVHQLPAIQGEQVSWRYTLISGLIPALPLIFIRPFLPESPVWQEKKARGALKRPSIASLFSPQLCRTTIVTTILFACAFGVAFGALQITPQIVRGAFGPTKGPDMAKLVAYLVSRGAQTSGEKSRAIEVVSSHYGGGEAAASPDIVRALTSTRISA